MVGFDPTALDQLLTRWKARLAHTDQATAEAWRVAIHELKLVIAVSPFGSQTPKSPSDQPLFPDDAA